MFKAWADERCIIADDVSAQSRELYIDYAAWHKANKLDFASLIVWGKFMSNKFVRYRSNGRIRYRGICLRDGISKFSEFDV